MALDAARRVREDQVELALRAGQPPGFQGVDQRGLIGIVRTPASDLGGPSWL